MLNCIKCKKGHISGGQEGYAESLGKTTKYTGYIYCGVAKTHISIKPASECKDFDERPVYQINEEERCKHCYEKGIMFCICQNCKNKEIPDENCTSCFGSGTEHHCPKCGTVAKPITEYEY